MLRYVSVVLALAAGTLPAAADEFTDTVESALAAYNEGDVEGARQDLEYATKLLAAMKAETLARFLPEPVAGWAREDADDAGEAGGIMAMFGGGTTASATYRNGTEEMTITLVAGSPMVSGMAAMIGGLASAGGGKPIRIQRTEFGVTDGELQGVVGSNVLVSVSGNASIEDKTAHIEAMDLKALADF